MAYAETTTVPVERTKVEIEKVLAKAGATAFGYATDEKAAQVRFVMRGRQIKFTLPFPDAKSTQRRTAAQTEAARAQALRSRWRGLLLTIKAKLEAIESGIVTFEDEFLAFTLLSDGSTVGEAMGEQVAEHYRLGGPPRLLLGGPGETHRP